MDNIIKLLPIYCNKYCIYFTLNLKPPPAHQVTGPVFYGALDIYITHDEGGGPFTHVKSYLFGQFGKYNFPQIREITVTNFIEKIPVIVSIFENIILNNNNPWVRLLPTSDQPAEHLMNLKTNKISQKLPANIRPWNEYREGGRHYVSSLTHESSWTLPEVFEGDREPYINTVLKEIIGCLNGIIENPEQTQMLIDESEKIHYERKVMNTKITRVFIVNGHSMCNRAKIHFDPNMCVMTLSKLGDPLLSPLSIINTVISDINNTVISDINKIVKSPESVVGSYVELAEGYREKNVVYPQKVKHQSIRVRCGGRVRGRVSTISNQLFFGGKRTKIYDEGIFMVDNVQREYQDISKTILTQTDMKNIYTETTEFQKRIIEFESQQPDITSIPLDDYKKYFESHEEEFHLEFESLEKQRIMFCISLNYSKNDKEIELGALMCRGIDVATLQHYYDCIVEWEKENDMFANEYFKTEHGLEIFMDNFRISHKNEKDKKNKIYLSTLSNQRMQQLVNHFEKYKLYSWITPLSTIKFDYQEVSSLYQQTSCHHILQKIQALYPENEKLVILKGCRGISGEDMEEPTGSDNEGLVVDRGGRGRRQHLIMKMKIKKNTCKKNKKLSRTRVKKNKKYFY